MKNICLIRLTTKLIWSIKHSEWQTILAKLLLNLTSNVTFNDLMKKLSVMGVFVLNLVNDDCCLFNFKFLVASLTQYFDKRFNIYMNLFERWIFMSYAFLTMVEGFLACREATLKFTFLVLLKVVPGLAHVHRMLSLNL